MGNEMIAVRCPHCQKAFTASREFVGRRAKCKQCGQAFTIAPPDPVPAPPPPKAGQDASKFQYWAFISYSSKDKSWGSWLHRAIETYGIPAEFVKHRQTPTGHPAPNRFHPVFRDREELPASSDLGAVIRKALGDSHYLIVICSPNAARSFWVNEEIETFLALGRRKHILAIIVDGEPNTADARECFPPALRKFEPIAADARPQGDGKTNAKLKLLAGMLGVNFDSLKQRDKQRQKRRRILLGVAAALLVTVMTVLAGIARNQRQSALDEKINSDRRLYAKNMLEIQTAWDQANMRLFVKLLDDQRPEHNGGEDLRGFEWYYWWKQGHSELLTLTGPDEEGGTVWFSPDLKRLALVGEDGVLAVWDSATGKELFAMKDKSSGSGCGVWFSPDGKRIATGHLKNKTQRVLNHKRGTSHPYTADDMVTIWDAASGKQLFTFYGPENGDEVACVCFSPDGKHLASLVSEGVKTWDVENGQQLQLVSIPGAANVDQACFSPDCKRLATSDAGGIVVWDTTSGRQLLSIKEASRNKDIRLSPDGNQLATADGEKISVWNVVSGKELFKLGGKGTGASYTSVCFSPDGKRLVGGGTDISFKVWDATSGKILYTLKGIGLINEVMSVCFSSDGKWLATVSTTGNVMVWNATNKEAITYKEDKATASIGPDGTRRASFVPAGGTVSDATNGLQGRCTSIEWEPEEGGSEEALSPDGKRIALVSGADDAENMVEESTTVTICNSGKGAGRDVDLVLLRLQGHKAKVIRVCFSLDGRRLISEDDSGMVKIWDAMDPPKPFHLQQIDHEAREEEAQERAEAMKEKAEARAEAKAEAEAKAKAKVNE
jgi:WD40 repeat protein